MGERGGGALAARPTLGRAGNRPGDSDYRSSIKIHKMRSTFIHYRFTNARTRGRGVIGGDRMPMVKDGHPSDEIRIASNGGHFVATVRNVGGGDLRVRTGTSRGT